MKYMIQCKFEYNDGPEIVYQYAWVDYEFGLKVNMMAMFKNDERKWKIIEVGHIVQSVKEIQTTWLVGGNTEITARKEIA